MNAWTEQFEFDASLAHRGAVVLFTVLIGGLYFALTTHDADVGFYSDDAVYLLMAQWYSPWSAASDDVLAYVAQQSRFPPVYPLILGWLGVGVDQPVLASRITVGFLVLSMALFLWWVYRETGRIWIAVMVAGVFALLPTTILMAQDLWSELPYMAFVFLACLAVPAERSDGRRWLAAGLAVALASLTRSAGVALVLAYIVVVALRRPPRAWFLAAVGVVPALIWNIYRGITGQAIHFDTYAGVLKASTVSGWLHGLLAFFEAHVSALADGWVWLVAYRLPESFPAWTGPAVALVIAGAALVGMVLRIGRQRLDAIYVAIYLLMVTVWPFSGAFFTSRFLFPVTPFLIYYAGVGFSAIVGRSNRAVLGFAVTVGLLVMINMPTSVHFVNRAFTAVDPEFAAFTRSRKWLRASDLRAAETEAEYRRDLIASLRRVFERVPEGQCVYAVPTPLVMLYSRRIALLPPGRTRPYSDFVSGTRQCRYFVSVAIAPGGGDYGPFYPVERLTQEPGIAIHVVAIPGRADAEPLVVVAERARQN